MTEKEAVEIAKPIVKQVVDCLLYTSCFEIKIN